MKTVKPWGAPVPLPTHIMTGGTITPDAITAIFVLIACLLFCSPVFAQLDVAVKKAKSVITTTTRDVIQIVDETGVPIGSAATRESDPVVKPSGEVRIVAATTEAANVEYEFEDAARNVVEFAESDDQTYSIVDVPGKYWYTVTAIDFPKNIYSRKRGVIEFGSPVPPPDPDPPISGAVKEASRKGAMALSDQPTSTAMASLLKQAVQQATGKSLVAQKETVRLAIETTLLNRKGISQTKDWLRLWREPVNNAIAGEAPTVTTYLPLIQQAIAGLEAAVAKQSSYIPYINHQSDSDITMYSMSPCHSCDEFRLNELPRLQGVPFAEVHKTGETGVKTFPSFMLHAGGKKKLIEGYQTAEVLIHRLHEMENGQ